MPSPMDHPVTARADEDQVGQLGLVAGLEILDGSSVMRLDEVMADVAVAFLERHFAA